MTEQHNRNGARPDRRAFLRHVGGATAAAAAGVAASAALAEDAALDALIGDTQKGSLGQGFDEASRNIHMPKASEPTVSAATAQTTEQAVERYAAIVARGGWPQIPPVNMLQLGDRHPGVIPLRARLVASGDIDPNAAGTDVYNSYVLGAVRRFQARHGITVDGVIRAETLAALNVPAPVRLSQLKTNVTRLRTLGANLSPRYVVANIPAARIEAIENGVAVSRHAAVAGKPDRPSPEINSKIVQINFNPYWTVPPSIVQKDLIPKMQDAPDYLTKNHIRIFDSKQKELEPSQINWYSSDATHYSFKQDPGSLNSLGSIRINFPQRLRRLHARHAAEKSVRRGFSFPFVRLHAGAECAPARGLALTGDARLDVGGHRPGDQIRRPQGCPVDQARAAALGLHHRLVRRRRCRAVPRGHLRQGRLGGRAGRHCELGRILKNPA